MASPCPPFTAPWPSSRVGQSVKPRTTVPEGMALWRLPAPTYAFVVHRGPVVRIDDTLAHIYGTWLPHSDYEPVGAGSLERYEHERYCGGKKSEFDILIAVKPRRQGRDH